jgi:nicotinamidase-related amidase
MARGGASNVAPGTGHMGNEQEHRLARHGRHRDGVPHKTGVIVVDMANPYRHPEADRLATRVADAIGGVARLIQRADAAEIPLIYVNDNYGDWNSSADELAEKAMEGAHPELVEPILPDGAHSFVIKARHSVFYETPLEYLLDQMGVDRLILCGQVTEQCILYSALDAHVRHFDVVIPTDAVAAIYDHLADAALEMMKRNLSAELSSSSECALE